MGSAHIGIKSCVPGDIFNQYLYELFKICCGRVPGVPGRPEELSDRAQAGKYNLERRMDFERLRDAAGPAYIDIESCVPE